MTKKYRVSAKQRLELVEQAFRILNKEDPADISQMDYELFVDKVAHALYGELTPRNAVEEAE